MLTSHTPAQQDRQRDPKPGRTRALVAAGGALAAAAAWIVEVPLLGVGLSIRFGGGHQGGGRHIQTIGPARSSESAWPPRCSGGCCSPSSRSGPRTPGGPGPAWP